ncbi:HicB family protein [Alicyclobacillus acidoterrestris]|nr:HicB family protein [Alicyclobacillus acidoterrestris]
MGTVGSNDWFRYPATLTYEDDGITVEFIDFPGAVTCGDTEEEAFRNAKECLALAIIGAEQDGESLPAPTPISKFEQKGNRVLTLVEVYLPPYRKAVREVYVKKNLTIPKWLDDLAKEHNVNYSQILQGALRDYLGISDEQK